MGAVPVSSPVRMLPPMLDIAEPAWPPVMPSP